MVTYWRIIDLTVDAIVAESLPDINFANETLSFLKRDNPTHKFEVVAYSKPTVTGMGRDPDLH